MISNSVLHICNEWVLRVCNGTINSVTNLQPSNNEIIHCGNKILRSTRNAILPMETLVCWLNDKNDESFLFIFNETPLHRTLGCNADLLLPFNE